MERLVVALGIPPTVVSEPIMPKDLHRLHPGTVGWLDAHPVQAGLAITVVVVVVIVGGVLLFAV
jgi:hypothetical protein